MARPALSSINAALARYNNEQRSKTSTATDEGGNLIGGPSAEMPELTKEQYDKLSDDQLWGLIGQSSVASDYYSGDGSRYRLADDDPLAGEFSQKFGAKEFQNVEMNNQKLDGLIHGRGDIRLYGKDPSEWMQDPSRIMYLDDGSWVIEAGNLKGDALAKMQGEDADSGFFKGDAATILKVAAVFAAAYGAGTLLEGGLTEAAPLQLSGPGSTMTGVTPGVEAATGLETAGAGVGGGTGTVSTDGMWDIPGGDTIASGEGAAPPPTGTPPATPAGGPGAPPSAVTPPSGTGLVDSVSGAARSVGNAAGGAMDWYNSLSPASRQIIGSAVSMGARAALQQSAQQSALEAQRDAEERARQDKIRRGQVQAYGPSAFTPKPLPGGLINRNGG